MNKSILYLAACGIAALGAAYMSYSYQSERSEELVRNAKYKAIPNGLEPMMRMQRPPMILNASSEAPKAGARPKGVTQAKSALARKKGTADQQKHAHAAAPDLKSPATSN